MSKPAYQFTVRGVSAPVARALRAKAAALHKSLNAVLLEALASAAGVGAGRLEQRDLDRYSGTWVDDPKVDRALAERRRVDPKDWA